MRFSGRGWSSALCLVLLLTCSSCVILLPFIESDYVPPVDDGIGAPSRIGYPGRVTYGSKKARPVQAKVRRLIADLKNKDAVVRTHAATDLGAFGGAAEEAVEPLAYALDRDQSKWVRRAAAKALGKIGTRRGAEALKNATRDKDRWVAHSAKNALARLRSRK